MTKLYLGKTYEEEGLETENKAFHLYSHSLQNISDDEVFDIFSQGKWTSEFEEIVETNVLEFIYHILPKYITCFANANIDGCINIGVDDDCELTGIPYLGTIPKDKIQETIYQTIEEHIETNQNIKEHLEIEYIPLEIDDNLLRDDSEILFDKYSRDRIDYNNKMEIYLNQKAEFMIQHRKYSQKLETMLNITQYRQELADYIRQETGDVHIHLIDLLLGSQFIKLRQDNFLIDKERTNRDRIFYWIAKYRDIKIQENSYKKPNKPIHTSIYHPSQILSHLPIMRAKFIKHNPGLHYYLLRIVCRVGHLRGGIRFWDRFHQKWLYRKRVDSNNQKDGPSCLPL